jgi:hypothetical protein
MMIVRASIHRPGNHLPRLQRKGAGAGATGRAAAALRSIGRGLRRVLRAGFCEPQLPFGPNDALTGRYFGLLVHVGGTGHSRGRP